jgi:predicted transposase YdaD
MTTKPFDISLKDLVSLDPLAWATYLSGEPVIDARLVDADASTVSAQADKAIRVELHNGSFLLHLEPQSSHDAELPERMHFYSTVLQRRYQLPVLSVALLLRPEANARALTGVWQQQVPRQPLPYLRFAYQVIRVWELALQPLLQGPLPLLPLAALTNEAQPQIEQVVQRVVERARTETSPDQGGIIELALFLLLGLRHDQDFIHRLVEGVQGMEESSFYQLILERGEARGVALGEARGEAKALRDTILRLGRRHLGEPTPQVVETLMGLSEVERLRQLTDRLLDVTSWEDLLA